MRLHSSASMASSFSTHHHRRNSSLNSIMSQERDLFELAYGAHMTLTPEQKQAVQARAHAQIQYSSQQYKEASSAIAAAASASPSKHADRPELSIDTSEHNAASQSLQSPTVFSASMLPLNTTSGHVPIHGNSSDDDNRQQQLLQQQQNSGQPTPVAVQEEVASLRMSNMQQHFLSQLAKLEQQCQNYCEQITELTDRLHGALGDNQQLTRDLALAKESANHYEGRVAELEEGNAILRQLLASHVANTEDFQHGMGFSVYVH